MTLLLRYDDASGRPRARVLRGTISVGRGAGAGIVLDGAAVAGLHATIDADRVPPVLSVVAPDAALFVNGLLVWTAPLADGDVIRFGETEARVVLAARWAQAVHEERAAGPPRPPEPATAPVPAPPPGSEFPFLRVAAVTAALFAAAFGIYALRGAKWLARLDQEDVRATERRAQALLTLLKPSPTDRGTGTQAPASSSLASAGASSLSGSGPITPATAAENVLSVALRSVVSITGDVRVDGQWGTILGSGFFVSQTGLILTNAHVMDHEGRYVAHTHDGRGFVLMDRERDRSLDLGLLAARGDGPFPPLPFGSAKGLTYGDQVWAIGSPLSPELGFSVTRGVVSSPLRVLKGRSFLQHDAAINPGNSGGPVVDSAGRLVGVNTWKIMGEAQGLGFAIPVEVVEETLKAWKVQR